MPESPNGQSEENELETAKNEADLTTDENAASGASTEAEEGEKSEKTFLDAVQGALETDKEDTPASLEQDSKPSEEEGQESTDENADDDDPENGFTEEERKHLSDKTFKRMRNLANDKKRLATEVEQQKPIVERWNTLQAFARENSLSGQDVSNTLQIAALVQTDPAKALEHLEPLVADMRRAVGAELPEDLQEQVRLGYITKPAAQELSKRRAQEHLNTQKGRQILERENAQRQEQEAQESRNVASRAADDWHKSQKAKDPDFGLKLNRITEKTQLALTRMSRTPTAEETVALLDSIKKEVDQELRSLRPKPKEVNNVDGDASSGTRSKPTSMLEAMEQAVSS